MKKNEWDVLSKKVFNVHRSEDEIDPLAADNILIAWPPIISLIETHFGNLNKKSLSALDYGCGTGGFTHKLHSLGFSVMGADNSEGMLRVARESLPKDITLIDSDILPDMKYDLITGVMVFQFVEDVEETLKSLTKHLKKGGLFVFAVFNPPFVTQCLNAKIFFSDFKSAKNPKAGLVHLGENVSIPTYIRSANEYDHIINKLGLKKVLEIYPPFTEEFLKKYAWDLPASEPEYLILGYEL